VPKDLPLIDENVDRMGYVPLHIDDDAESIDDSIGVSTITDSIWTEGSPQIVRQRYALPCD
jgi:hypothetical protein